LQSSDHKEQLVAAVHRLQKELF